MATPPTVQSFTTRVAWAVSDLTLVTLECTPVDFAMSVSGRRSAVYSPSVLRLGAQFVTLQPQLPASTLRIAWAQRATPDP